MSRDLVVAVQISFRSFFQDFLTIKDVVWILTTERQQQLKKRLQGHYEALKVEKYHLQKKNMATGLSIRRMSVVLVGYSEMVDGMADQTKF
jgi:hypothetical protein